MSVPRAVLRWFERQVGRTVTLRDGRKMTLRLVDACSGDLSLCIELPESGVAWIGLDEIELSTQTVLDTTPVGAGRKRERARGAA